MRLKSLTLRVTVIALVLLTGGAMPSAAAYSTAAISWRAAAQFRPPLPMPLHVANPFIAPASPYGPGHRGVDLTAAAGQSVTAVAPGVVVYAGFLVDRGVVSVEHTGGMRSTYEPLEAAVSAGDVVAAGTLLGSVTDGHARCAPQTCLHWGIRLPDRVYLDPMSLLRPWQVRLKPWEG